LEMPYGRRMTLREHSLRAEGRQAEVAARRAAPRGAPRPSTPPRTARSPARAKAAAAPRRRAGTPRWGSDGARGWTASGAPPRAALRARAAMDSARTASAADNDAGRSRPRAPRAARPDRDPREQP